MPVNINGLTGIESPGYSQGGDPIVESGSNSDGEWTRWADGTLRVAGVSDTIDITTALGGWFHGTSMETLPIPLVDTNNVVGFASDTNSSAVVGGVRRSTTTAAIVMLAYGSSISNRAAVWSLFGRWK